MSRLPALLQENVLIVDAAPDKLHLLASALVNKGIQVQFASNSQFALTLVQASVPDLILLNLAQLEPEGDQLCHQLRTNPQTAAVPVVLLRAGAEQSAQSRQSAAANWISQSAQIDAVQIDAVLAEIELQLQVQRLRRAFLRRTVELKQAQQQLEQQGRISSLLQKIMSVIRSQPERQRVFEAVIAEIGQAFQVDRASMQIYVPPPMPEVLPIAEYVKPGHIQAGDDSRQQINFVLKDSRFLAEVLAHDQAIATADFYGDRPLDLDQHHWRDALNPSGRNQNQLDQSQLDQNQLEQNQSLLAIRTAYRNQVNGVIILQQFDDQRHWTADERAGLEVIAAQVGLELAQVKMLEQEQKQLEALGYQNRVLRHEICERREVEAALQASEAELRSLFAAMVDVILVLDWQGRYLRIAPTSQENLCRPMAKLVGQTLHQVFDQAQADRFLSAIRHSLNRQQQLDLEYRLMIQGREVWFNAKISPIGANAVLWVARDVTARRQTEAELRDKSAALSEFSRHLKQLHRLNLTDFESVEGLCTDYLKTGCEILGFVTGVASQVIGQVYRVMAVESSLPTLLVPEQRLALARLGCNQVVQSRQTVCWLKPDPSPQPGQLPALGYAERQIEAYLGTPIWVDGELYGTLCFFSPKPRTQAYSDHELEIIELIAQSIGKFISSHQAKAKRQQAEEEVQLLLNITQAITAAPDFNAALYAALSALCQATGWIYGEVWLPAADGTVLESSPVWYCSEPPDESESAVAAVRQFRHSLKQATFHPNEGIAGRVWSRQQPEWTTDEQDWPEPYSAEIAGTEGAASRPVELTEEQFQYRFQLVSRYGIKARLGVPIITADSSLSQSLAGQPSTGQHPTVLAVLVFFTLEARPQNQRLIQLVSGVAMQLGAVLAQKQAEDALRQSAEREQALLRVIERMRQSLEIEQIFRTTTKELHQLLKCDRVLIYRFNSDWSGEIVAEAVADRWQPVLAGSLEDAQPLATANATEHDRCIVRTWNALSDGAGLGNYLEDSYLKETQGGIYSRGGKYLCVQNVQQTNLSDCYLALLDQLQAKAYLTVPIFQGQRLWGLLATYQNSGPRNWQPSEIHLVTHVSTQLGVALQQAELLSQTQRQSADLEKARDAAEAANRAKTQFLAHMSHELRTPLNSILGFTQLVGQAGGLSSEHQDYLRIVSSSGQHLLGLINNVLELARLEANRASLQIVQFDLLVLLEQIGAMLKLAASEKQLNLNLLLAADLPRYILADQSKLRQVLLNLLDNAIKFTQQGSVTLQVERIQVERIQVEQTQVEQIANSSERSVQSGWVGLHFAVIDTGYGIAAAEIDSLFEAFVQSESGRQSHQGTGLGLVISCRFVQLMGGRLKVSSQLGAGSRFEFEIWVQLPLELARSQSGSHLGLLDSDLSLDSGSDSSLDSGSGSGPDSLPQLRVHCMYGTMPGLPELSVPVPLAALSAALDLMPADWRHQLYQAASGCSERQVLRLIDQIPTAQADLAKGLAGLASNFQFEAIVELTQSHFPSQSQFPPDSRPDEQFLS